MFSTRNRHVLKFKTFMKSKKVSINIYFSNYISFQIIVQSPDNLRGSVGMKLFLFSF